jgi:hypothetical protein
MKAIGDQELTKKVNYLGRRRMKHGLGETISFELSIALKERPRGSVIAVFLDAGFAGSETVVNPFGSRSGIGPEGFVTMLASTR